MPPDERARKLRALLLERYGPLSTLALERGMTAHRVPTTYVHPLDTKGRTADRRRVLETTRCRHLPVDDHVLDGGAL